MITMHAPPRWTDRLTDITAIVRQFVLMNSLPAKNNWVVVSQSEFENYYVNGVCCRLWRQALFQVLSTWFLILTQLLCMMIIYCPSSVRLVNVLYFMVTTRGLGCFQRCFRDLMERRHFLLQITLRFCCFFTSSESLSDYCFLYWVY